MIFGLNQIILRTPEVRGRSRKKSHRRRRRRHIQGTKCGVQNMCMHSFTCASYTGNKPSDSYTNEFS